MNGEPHDRNFDRKLEDSAVDAEYGEQIKLLFREYADAVIESDVIAPEGNGAGPEAMLRLRLARERRALKRMREILQEENNP